MIPTLMNLEIMPPAELKLVYENGEKRIFDVSPLFSRGMFKTLLDPSIFTSAKVSFDTVEWANGVDIDPETLYADSIPIEQWMVAERPSTLT